jgi:hypothetical protein
MDFEKITKTEEIKKEYSIVSYSEQDIRKLITADIEKNGQKAEKIYFKTDNKIVSDEWGMNSHTVAVFNGAVAELLTDTQ